MQYPRTIRNFNAFIDGVSYAGRVLEGKLPELKLQTASHRGGGMDGPLAIDMGMEALQSEITLAEWPPELIKMFGTRQRMTFRPGAMGEHDLSADSFVASLGGRWSVVNFADLKPGSDVPLKLSLEVDYVRMQKDGDELFEIDIEAGKRVIGGVDQLAEMRRAMGL
ncbi:phage major tail tube protein [Palleronia caenipelagi]|uniref:Phage major tail tube protein n=1 Tax=Palleronia caenipelagi TaxID=2489174 RepID=A0A547PWB1_9RHOB|nr:phage major tail tube protein [Palleronia caenipelagi]TRD18406.1 phage major tail tube protein [Palleronia caenipelagi]